MPKVKQAIKQKPNAPYRTAPQIEATILELAKAPISRTRIMYGAVLSYPQLVDYIDRLLNDGLLTTNDQGLYNITGKGLSYLECLHQMQAIRTSVL